MKIEVEISESSIVAELQKQVSKQFQYHIGSFQWDERVKKEIAQACDAALKSVISDMIANDAEAIRKQVADALTRKIQSQLTLAMKAAKP